LYSLASMSFLSSFSHYDVLNVDKVATPAEIKRAYRQKALKHHPDKDATEHATAYFQRILEAYEVLSSTRLRFLYDTGVRKCTVEEENRVRNEAARQRAMEEQELRRSTMRKRLTEACKVGATFEAMKLLRGMSHSDVNAFDDLGRTCLMYSVERQSAQLVSLLLLYQADVNLVNSEGWSPVLEAVNSAANLTDDSAQARLSCLRALLEAKASPNIATDAGATPLLLACASGCSSMVQCLLEFAADPNFSDDSARTPLMLAADSGHVGVVGALLKAGASVDALDTLGRPALMSAVCSGHKDVVAMLLEAEANPCRKAGDGCTALMSAVECLVSPDGHSRTTHAVAIVRMLLDARVDLDDINGDGGTPLRLADLAGDADVFAMLVGGSKDLHAPR